MAPRAPITSFLVPSGSALHHHLALDLAVPQLGCSMNFHGPSLPHDQGFPDWFGPGNINAPEGARLLAGKASA